MKIKHPEYYARQWFTQIKKSFNAGKIDHQKIYSHGSLDLISCPHPLIQTGLVSGNQLIGGAMGEHCKFTGIPDPVFRVMYLYIDKRFQNNGLGTFMVGANLGSFTNTFGHNFYWVSNVDGDSSRMRSILKKAGLTERAVKNAVDQNFLCTRMGKTEASWSDMDQCLATSVPEFLETSNDGI